MTWTDRFDRHLKARALVAPPEGRKVGAGANCETPAYGEAEWGNDDQRLADLRRKLQAREGQPGYSENVKALKAEIARLEGHEPEEPDRLTDLKRKLAAREGQPGYRENVEALKAEIARLEEGGN